MQSNNENLHIYLERIKTDAEMKFYTRINTIALFDKMLRLRQTFLSNIYSSLEGTKTCERLY